MALKPNHILHSPADFDAAIASGAHVEVWQRGELIGTGIIQKHTKDAVQIDGSYYLKAACQFYVT